MLPFFSELSHPARHCILSACSSALLGGRPSLQEDAMADLPYVTDLHTKTKLRPSPQAIKRAALALAVALGVAGAADFGYGHLTTGRYLETPNHDYFKPDSPIVSPKLSPQTPQVLPRHNHSLNSPHIPPRL